MNDSGRGPGAYSVCTSAVFRATTLLTRGRRTHAQSNFALITLPPGGVIWTTPFGCAGSAAAAFPDSCVSPAGSSTMRWLLPSMAEDGDALVARQLQRLVVMVAQIDVDRAVLRHHLDMMLAGLDDPAAMPGLGVVGEGWGCEASTVAVINSFSFMVSLQVGERQ